MFDNPKKELERLQQELLAAEAPEPENTEYVEDTMDTADYTPPMEWDEEERPPLSHSYTDQGDDCLIWEAPTEDSAETEEEEEPEPQHYAGLKLTIALELLGIAALFWWWYLWIR